MNDICITMKKLGMEIERYCIIHELKNVINKDKKIEGKSKRVWFGIKPK